MRPYILKILSEFPEHIGRTAVTPAGNHLFEVHDNSTRRLLLTARADAFHRAVSQLLFLGMRVSGHTNGRFVPLHPRQVPGQGRLA